MRRTIFDGFIAFIDYVYVNYVFTNIDDAFNSVRSIKGPFNPSPGSILRTSGFLGTFVV